MSAHATDVKRVATARLARVLTWAQATTARLRQPQPRRAEHDWLRIDPPKVDRRA